MNDYARNRIMRDRLDREYEDRRDYTYDMYDGADYRRGSRSGRRDRADEMDYRDHPDGRVYKDYYDGHGPKIELTKQDMKE
jgi:hypothetical protein